MSREALVTGGTHGIGLSIARRLKADGYAVTVLARGNWEPEENFSFICGDALSSYIQLPDLGNIDVLINNVGGGGRWGNAIWEDTPLTTWKEVWQKNVGIAALLVSKVIPGMIERGFGRIVTVSSLYGREAGGRPWFTAAKAAQIAMMKEFSREPRYASRGITFNTVAPGRTWIPGTAIEQEDREALSLQVPMRRLGTPEEVANAVSFLVSHEASWVNGTCLAIDGGEGVSL